RKPNETCQPRRRLSRSRDQVDRLSAGIERRFGAGSGCRERPTGDLDLPIAIAPCVEYPPHEPLGRGPAHALPTTLRRAARQRAEPGDDRVLERREAHRLRAIARGWWCEARRAARAGEDADRPRRKAAGLGVLRPRSAGPPPLPPLGADRDWVASVRTDDRRVRAQRGAVVAA